MKLLILILTTFCIPGAFADWTESLSYKGDIRLRTEGIKEELENKRWRQRIRARLKLNAKVCLLYTSPSPRDQRGSRMPSSA